LRTPLQRMEEEEEVPDDDGLVWDDREVELDMRGAVWPAAARQERAEPQDGGAVWNALSKNELVNSVVDKVMGGANQVAEQVGRHVGRGLWGDDALMLDDEGQLQPLHHLRANVQTMFVTFVGGADAAAGKGGALQKAIDIICSENGAHNVHSVVVLTELAADTAKLASNLKAASDCKVEVQAAVSDAEAKQGDASTLARAVLIQEVRLLEQLARQTDAPNVVFFRPNVLFLQPVADMWRNHFDVAFPYTAQGDRPVSTAVRYVRAGGLRSARALWQEAVKSFHDHPCDGGGGGGACEELAVFGALAKHVVNFDRPAGAFQQQLDSGHRFSLRWRIHTSPHRTASQSVLSRTLGVSSLGKVFTAEVLLMPCGELAAVPGGPQMGDCKPTEHTSALQLQVLPSALRVRHLDASVNASQRRAALSRGASQADPYEWEWGDRGWRTVATSSSPI
jgi:hypothetical protein